RRVAQAVPNYRSGRLLRLRKGKLLPRRYWEPCARSCKQDRLRVALESIKPEGDRAFCREFWLRAGDVYQHRSGRPANLSYQRDDVREDKVRTGGARHDS